MKLCKVSDLQGGEILARSVMTSEFNVLLSQETKLHQDYIEKLIELDINEVYIREDEYHHTEKVVILKQDIEKNFTEKVKKVLEKHTHNKNKQLEEINKTADSIINNILEENDVIEKVFDIKERSSDIYEHSINICALSILVAIKMGLSQSSTHDIGVACLLHDLGLRYVTVDYNNKMLSNMTEIEAAEYKKHPIYSYSALQSECWISESAKIMILNHHERIDGSGYPLRERKLSLEAKIINVCDCFDEMICGIGCERSKVSEAVEYLKLFKGIKFDKAVVDVFLEFTAVFPAGSKVMTNTGEIGIVIRQNREFPDRPVIKLIKDKSGNLIRKESIVDLIKVNHVFIEKALE